MRYVWVFKWLERVEKLWHVMPKNVHDKRKRTTMEKNEKRRHSRFHNHCQQQQPKRLLLNCWLFSAITFSASRPLWHSMCYLMTEFRNFLMIYGRDCCYCSSLIESHWFDCSMASTALEDLSVCLQIPYWYRSDCWVFLDTLGGDIEFLRVKRNSRGFEAKDLPCVADIDTYTRVKYYCNKVL